MEAPREPEEAETPPERTGIDRHLAVFVEEPTLWPVTLALVLAFTTAGAALMLLAVTDRNLFALAALLILLWMSVDVIVRRRRFGPLVGLLLTLWLLSGCAACAFVYFGLF